MLIRTLIVPSEGCKYVCACDFSAQEPRLIINDASRINATSIEVYVKEFNKNPAADFHQLAADIMEVDRTVAKTIGLGLLYGMGDYKLASSLNVDIKVAQMLKEKYFTSLPFMKELIDSMTKCLSERGYIKTIGGNRLHLDSPVDWGNRVQTFEYKALNKRIQGSAAYQTNKALVDMYRSGVPFLFPVHDEIVCSIQTVEDANTIQRIMEDAYEMAIPSLAEPSYGPTWAECK